MWPRNPLSEATLPSFEPEPSTGVRARAPGAETGAEIDAEVEWMDAAFYRAELDKVYSIVAEQQDTIERQQELIESSAVTLEIDPVVAVIQDEKDFLQWRGSLCLVPENTALATATWSEDWARREIREVYAENDQYRRTCQALQMRIDHLEGLVAWLESWSVIAWIKRGYWAVRGLIG